MPLVVWDSSRLCSACVPFPPPGKIFHPAAEPGSMRGKIDTDTLLFIVLALAVLWLLVELVTGVLASLSLAAVVLPNLLGVAIVVSIVLWWFDYI